MGFLSVMEGYSLKQFIDFAHNPYTYPHLKHGVYRLPKMKLIQNLQRCGNRTYAASCIYVELRADGLACRVRVLVSLASDIETVISGAVVIFLSRCLNGTKAGSQQCRLKDILSRWVVKQASFFDFRRVDGNTSFLVASRTKITKRYSDRTKVKRVSGGYGLTCHLSPIVVPIVYITQSVIMN